jgi:hypothetical protein
MVTDLIEATKPRPTKMKMLKRLFQYSRESWQGRSWRAGRKPPTEPQLYSSVASDEFARLLMSRKPGDLKILARKLSLPAKVSI